MNVIVVGAGLAGPTCAKALREGGVEPDPFPAGEYTEDPSINDPVPPGEKAVREVVG